ncbi:MAG: DUF4013 domain-containing protein [Planctomycetota bacterium]
MAGSSEAGSSEAGSSEAGSSEAGAVGPWRGRWRALWAGIYGLVGLLVGLSVLSAIPVLQFATLGWLLEAEGRLARGEGWRRGLLPGLRAAAPLGAGLIGCGLLLLPFLVLWHLHIDAQLLSPGSGPAVGWGRAALVYGALAAAHAAVSLAAGRGSLLAFATPFANLQALHREGLRLPRARELGAHLGQSLELGLKGFLAGAAWLTPPTALLAAGMSRQNPLLGLLGAVALVLSLRSALVAQARVAAEGRLGAAFEWGAIRQAVRRAPLATALALLLTLALALPLYLLKVEELPRDTLWLPALVFLVAAWPGRVAAGWALGRARHEGRAPWPLRLLGLALALPAAGAYVFFVFFNQFFAWNGVRHLFAHHAFLLPVAFY